MVSLRRLGTILSHLEAESLPHAEPHGPAAGAPSDEASDAAHDAADELGAPADAVPSA